MKGRPLSASSGLPGPLARVIRDAAGLGQIADRARRLDSLKSALRPLVPSTLRPHCDLANYRNGVIVMTASSPVWAARLRNSGAAILHTVRERLQIPARRLEVRVLPGSDREEPPPRPRELSEAARHSLQRAAENVRDEELAAVFRRILER